MPFIIQLANDRTHKLLLNKTVLFLNNALKFEGIRLFLNPYGVFMLKSLQSYISFPVKYILNTLEKFCTRILWPTEAKFWGSVV